MALVSYGVLREPLVPATTDVREHFTSGEGDDSPVPTEVGEQLVSEEREGLLVCEGVRERTDSVGVASPLVGVTELPSEEDEQTVQSESLVRETVVAPSSQRRRRVRVVLCRVMVVMVGVCVVLVSGVLAGVLRHPELDGFCHPGNKTCCSATSSEDWPTSLSSVLASSCVCSSPSVTLLPTPLPRTAGLLI